MKTSVLGLTLCLALIAAPEAAHAELWAKYGGTCDQTAFTKPGDASMKTLARCVRLFAAYRNTQGLPAGYKARVITAFKRLFKAGSNLDAHIAYWTLRRLGVGGISPRTATKAAPVGGKPTPTRVVKISAKKCSLSVPDGKAIKKAKKFLKAGMSLIKKEKYQAAKVAYDQMNALAGGWFRALRRTAELYVKLEKPKKALEKLKCLRDMGGKKYIQELRYARFDSDFAPLRRMPAFKRLTGYAQIAVLDTLPEDRGVENMDAFIALLDKIGYEPYVRKQTDGNRTSPVLLYGPYGRRSAYLISKLIDHPALKVMPMPKKFAATYFKKRGFDIVFYWGDRYDPKKPPKKRFPKPADAENLLSDVERKQNQMLRSPDKYTREVDKALGAPGKAIDRVGRGVDKVKRIGETPKKAVDKVKGTVDKIKSIF